MRDKEAIDKEIEEARNNLVGVHGKSCEIYTRICGYYRATHNFNIGKVEEYNARKEFLVPISCGDC